MSVLLITYDLNNPGQNYEDILAYIKKHSYTRLSESSYAIKTDKSPADIFKEIEDFLDKNDTIFIITLVLPWRGFGPRATLDWLLANL